MQRYDVILTAIDEGADLDQAIQAAAVVFGLDLVDAWRALESLPAKLLEDIDERSAEELLVPLRRAGWRVRLMPRARSSRFSSRPEGLRPAERPISSIPPAASPPAVSSWPPAPVSSLPSSTPAPFSAPGASSTPVPSSTPPRAASSAPPAGPARASWGVPGSLAPPPRPSSGPTSRPASSWPPPRKSSVPPASPPELASLPVPAFDEPLPSAIDPTDLSAPRLPGVASSSESVRSPIERSPEWTDGASDGLELDIDALRRASSHPPARVPARVEPVRRAPLAPSAAAPHDEPPPTTISFFTSLPRTLLIPFRGGAARWFLRSVTLAIGALGIVSLAAFAMMLGTPVAGFTGLGVALIAAAFWFAHLLTWFRACLWAGATGEAGPDAPADVGGFDELLDGFFTALMVFALFGVVNVGLLLTMGLRLADLAPSPELFEMIARRLLVANVVLGLHMPIGLALVALRRNRWSYFDLITAFKLVLFAPLQLLVVYALTVVATLATQVVLGELLALELPWWGRLAVVGTGSIAATLFQYGLMGAAFGALVRSKPHLAQ